MQYISTRDKNQSVSAAQAIAMGIAPDGGLFCPTEIPKLTQDDIKALCEMDYRGRSASVIGRFLEEFSAKELESFAAKAYADERFGSSNTAPLVKTEGGKYILELWHGPTCAFKDMALQMLPHLLTASLRKTGETRTACILVATSGDTGKAALDGFADVDGTKIMVYYPVDGVSTMQKLQMVTQEGKNVQVCAIRGNFDDAQSAVKKIFTDPETLEKLDSQGMMLSSANSINWGRLVPQIAYYVSAYCDLVTSGALSMGEPMNVCVPTGNFGNILAAYFAREMGIPIAKLICASNENNVLTDFFTSGGTYDRERPFHTTISPSMDILISSNLERLLFLASGYNDTAVAQMMKELSETGKYTVPEDIFAPIRSLFEAGCCSDAETCETIRRLFEDEHYLCDTHTAVAVSVYEQYCARTGDTTPTVIASTASPYKFCQSVIGALGGTAATDGTELLDQLHEMTGTEIPAPLAALRGKQPRFDLVIDKEEILASTDLLAKL
ncbi:MAG: threonine synthase [Eubacteriales bacterium]|nr:threonine synthase [Eubacteriales bacterium]